MVFTPIPNGVRVVHLGHIGNVQIVNTFGAKNGDAGGPGLSLQDIAINHAEAWRARLVPIMSSIYSHDSTLCYSLEDQTLAPGDAGLSGSVVGGSLAKSATPATCVVTSLKTAKRGRTYQGRAFLSPFGTPDVSTDGLSWSSALVAAVQTAMEGYKADVDPALTGNGALAVCSKGSPTHGISPHVEPVTGILVRSYIGTQRRRLS